MAYIDYNLQFSTENKLPMKNPNYGKSIYDPIEQSNEGIVSGSIALIITLVVVFFIKSLFNKKNIKTSNSSIIKKFEDVYKIKLEPYTIKYIDNFELINTDMKNIDKSIFDSIFNKYDIIEYSDKTDDLFTIDYLNKNKMEIAKDLASYFSDIYDIYCRTGEANNIMLSKSIYFMKFNKSISNNDVKNINNLLSKNKLKTSNLVYTPISNNYGKIDIIHACTNIDTLQLCKDIDESSSNILLIEEV